MTEADWVVYVITHALELTMKSSQVFISFVCETEIANRFLSGYFDTLIRTRW